ncbi:hypothetical protein [Candidatus Parabeggiatoa sp. HSG14]|uniref:hypothetical protein n=1 Tax=Candidatus Parabeggiatoa sp. HSG14 TaxID=3055593 RepID=UPI0025A73494|nr:hypothetical protein [Thiotrichales bacterium HSG14]
MTIFDQTYVTQFVQNLEKCEKAKNNLEYTLTGLQDIFPLDGEKLANLSREMVEKIDAMSTRFSRLQDLLGNRVFRSLTLLESEPRQRFLDVLNLMESRGIIESTQNWIELRNMRNEASHDYIEDTDKLAVVLTDIFTQAPLLIETVNQVERYATDVLQVSLS